MICNNKIEEKPGKNKKENEPQSELDQAITNYARYMTPIEIEPSFEEIEKSRYSRVIYENGRIFS